MHAVKLIEQAEHLAQTAETPYARLLANLASLGYWGHPITKSRAYSVTFGHLRRAKRDTSLVAISRAPFEKLAAYKRRMGWKFPWYSSYGSDYNYDFHVTLDPALAPLEYVQLPGP